MSSLDGMGRYYPLTLRAIADADAPISPPDVDTLDAWFGLAESLLLSTLAQVATFEGISAELDRLEAPPTRSGADAGIVSLGDDMAGMLIAGTDVATTLSALRDRSPEVYAAASFWWTVMTRASAANASGSRGLLPICRPSRLKQNA